MKKKKPVIQAKQTREIPKDGRKLVQVTLQIWEDQKEVLDSIKTANQVIIRGLLDASRYCDTNRIAS